MVDCDIPLISFARRGWLTVLSLPSLLCCLLYVLYVCVRVEPAGVQHGVARAWAVVAGRVLAGLGEDPRREMHFMCRLLRLRYAFRGIEHFDRSVEIRDSQSLTCATDYGCERVCICITNLPISKLI